MNILITGANGFVGKHLTQKMLDEGNDVFAIVTNDIGLKDDKLHTINCFFEEYNKLDNLINSEIDIVYHLAWDGLSGEKARDVDLQIKNVIATQRLLECCKKMKVKKFIFASTMNTLEVRRFIERPTDYTIRGVYVHVAAKINAEIIARTFCYENNIQFNEAIVAMTYGEGNMSKMVINVFIYDILNGISPNLVKGDNDYDVIYVGDVVNAFCAIGEKGINGKSYYVGHDWDKTFKEIFLDIKNVLNPNAFINFGAFPDDNKIDFSLINKKELNIDTGWQIKSDFADSIKSTANWLKKSGYCCEV